MYRQGDVLIMRVSEEQPDDDTRAETAGPIVLARGEVTGHTHAVHGRATYFRDDGAGAGGLLVVHETAEVRHQEHDTINLPKGRFRVVRQAEWDAGSVRRVAD